MSNFPVRRLRRLRQSEPLRRMVQETTLSPDEFVSPLFVTHGQGIREEIKSMPGVYHFSLDKLPQEVEEVASLEIPAVLLFGLPASKDDVGSEAYSAVGIVQEAVRTIKKTVPELLVVTDVCLCEY